MLAKRIPAKEKQCDAEKQQKACKVIAFKQTEQAEGIPVTEQEYDWDSCDRKFGEQAGPGDGLAFLRLLLLFFAAGFLSCEFAQEGIGQKYQAHESRDCAVERARRRHSGRAIEPERFGGPILSGMDDSAAEDEAGVRGARNQEELGGSVCSRSDEVSSVGAHGLRLKPAANNHEMLRHRARVAIEKHFRLHIMSGTHRGGRNGDDTCNGNFRAD